MALGIYIKEDDTFFLVSSADDLDSPLTTTHDGKRGDTKTLQLYVRNDDVTKWYSNIVITPVDLIDANPYGDVAYDETGWGVKLNQGSEEPTQGEWENVDWGDAIDMADVGADSGYDIATYYPLWYLISCPPNTDAQTKTDIVLDLAYTENAVS